MDTITAMPPWKAICVALAATGVIAALVVNKQSNVAAGVLFWGAMALALVVYILEKRVKAAEATAHEARLQDAGRNISRCGPVLLYADPVRLIAPITAESSDGAFREFPVTSGVRASVETAGSVAVTRGRDLGARSLSSPVRRFMFEFSERRPPSRAC